MRPPRPASADRLPWLGLLGGALGALYLLQLAGPIRVNLDAVRLLDMAWTKAATGLLPREQFPPIYPLVVVGLIKAGLVHPVWLALLNYAAFAVGIVAWGSVARKDAGWSRTSVVLGGACFFASWVMVKHAVIPLTEPLYFALSNLSLYSACRARGQSGRGAWPGWMLAVGLAALAAMTRTIGIALVGAIVLTGACDLLQAARAARATDERPGPRSQRTLIVIIGLLALGAAAAGWLLLASQLSQPYGYLNNWIASFRRGSAADLVQPLLFRAREFGVLTLNAPLRLNGLPLLLLTLTGLVSFVLVVRGSWPRRRRLPLVVAYATLYAAILAFWPFEDPRFWLPLLPWLFILAIPASVAEGPPVARSRLLSAALAGYLLLGFIALGYSTRLTFSGNKFAARYTHGSLRASYDVVFGAASPATDIPDPKAVAVLQHYAP